MVDFNRGGPERVQEEAETEDMSPGQRRNAVEVALDEFDSEMTSARHSSEEKIDEEGPDILYAYTDRIVDIFE